jgi:hypothetical protein
VAIQTCPTCGQPRNTCLVRTRWIEGSVEDLAQLRLVLEQKDQRIAELVRLLRGTIAQASEFAGLVGIALQRTGPLLREADAIVRLPEYTGRMALCLQCHREILVERVEGDRSGERSRIYLICGHTLSVYVIDHKVPERSMTEGLGSAWQRT